MKFYKLEMHDEGTAESFTEWFTTRKQAEHAERDFERRARWPKTKIREIDVPARKFGLLKVLREHAI